MMKSCRPLGIFAIAVAMTSTALAFEQIVHKMDIASVKLVEVGGNKRIVVSGVADIDGDDTKISMPIASAFVQGQHPTNKKAECDAYTCSARFSVSKGQLKARIESDFDMDGNVETSEPLVLGTILGDGTIQFTNVDATAAFVQFRSKPWEKTDKNTDTDQVQLTISFK